jgi:uncharacterized protein with PQ loop repeat
MKNISKITFIIGSTVCLIGLILFIFALCGIKKFEKGHRKISSDNFLLKSEKPVQKRNIIIFIVGLILMLISQIITGIISLS